MFGFQSGAVGDPLQPLNVVVTDQSLPAHDGGEGELLHVGQRLAENPRKGLEKSVDKFKPTC